MYEVQEVEVVEVRKCARGRQQKKDDNEQRTERAHHLDKFRCPRDVRFKGAMSSLRHTVGLCS